MLKVLQVHNRYFNGPGGEDTVLAEENALLLRHGHQVEQCIVETFEHNVSSKLNVAITGLQALWSPSGYAIISKAIKQHCPDIVHVHNTFPLLSPSVYWAAQNAGVPVVQTLHNYRFTCANALLLRDGKPCEECVGRIALPAIKYKCYKDSTVATSSLVAMQTLNRAIGSYSTKVDAYIALTDFAKAMTVRAGMPVKKVHVKPNFVVDYTQPQIASPPRLKQIVFVGNISQLKGVDILLQAWNALRPAGYKLVLIGDGREREELARITAGNESVDWRGFMDRAQVLEEIQQSRFLVLASKWYETFGMVVIEALCGGTPAIVPQLGAMPELIGEGRAGLVFRAGDAISLQETLEEAICMDESEWVNKSVQAREIYNSRYTPESNYQQLMAIYETVLQARRVK